MEKDYQFDIDVFSKENLSRVTAIMTTKGRGQTWDFYDPEDLANQALVALEKYVRKHPGIRRKKRSIYKMLSTITKRIWIREVRREKQKRNLVGSGSTRVSLFTELLNQIVDSRLDSEIALQEELDEIKRLLTSRQMRIVLMRLEARSISEISSCLNVSESTIDKENTAIKNVLKQRINQRATSNEQRATSNEQRATSNEQRATSNEQRRCNPTLKKCFPFSENSLRF